MSPSRVEKQCRATERVRRALGPNGAARRSAAPRRVQRLIRPGSPAVRKWPSKSNDNSRRPCSHPIAPRPGSPPAAQVRKAVASVTSRDDTALLRVRRESATRGPGRYLGPDDAPLGARAAGSANVERCLCPADAREAEARRAGARHDLDRVNGPIEYRDPTDRTSIRKGRITAAAWSTLPEPPLACKRGD